MDIHQQLLRKKIHKKRVMRNFASHVRTKYARTKDKILNELTQEDKYEDPMFKKKVDFYNQLFQPGAKLPDQGDKMEEDKTAHPNQRGRNQRKDTAEVQKKQPEKKLTKEQRNKLLQEKILKKKKEARKLMKKTDKGQPVMKNIINHLLKKIETKK